MLMVFRDRLLVNLPTFYYINILQKIILMVIQFNNEIADTLFVFL